MLSHVSRSEEVVRELLPRRVSEKEGGSTSGLEVASSMLVKD